MMNNENIIKSTWPDESSFQMTSFLTSYKSLFNMTTINNEVDDFDIVFLISWFLISDEHQYLR